jgi:hypothetical protein
MKPDAPVLQPQGSLLLNIAILMDRDWIGLFVKLGKDAYFQSIIYPFSFFANSI